MLLLPVATNEFEVAIDALFEQCLQLHVVLRAARGRRLGESSLALKIVAGADAIVDGSYDTTPNKVRTTAEEPILSLERDNLIGCRFDIHLASQCSLHTYLCQIFIA